jgi:hypothetical protein
MKGVRKEKGESKVEKVEKVAKCDNVLAPRVSIGHEVPCTCNNSGWGRTPQHPPC